MELHVGDVVRLKSGGPDMTVMEYPLKIALGEDNPNYTRCQWFDENGNKSQGTFLVDTLEKSWINNQLNISTMKKILLLALPIVVMCAVSCEKPEENNNEPNGPEEIAQGTIEAFATYNGQAAGFLYYSILDISQLDAIQTLSQQFHQACMNEDFDRVEDLEDSYYDIIGEGLCHQESSIGQDFYYDVDPGRYIVMASCYIAYYLNKELGDYFYAYRYLYKIVQVESNQITSVDFNFEDYIVY